MPQAAEDMAAELLAILGTGAQRGPLGLADMADAGQVTAGLRALREARGEQVKGRKIGFSNRTIWPLYGVNGPLWNYVWDTTVIAAPEGTAELSLAGMCEPRIEPEIVLGLGRAPEPGMDEAALMGCIDRVAHGFEIVQSVFAGWKFAAPDAAAAFGLHGALVVGPWHDIGADRAGWGARLRDFSVRLMKDGAVMDEGHARNVLDGPVTALRYLVETLDAEPGAAPLEAGEIVTTGTLTDAFPVAPGETWSTAFDGIGLEGLRLRMAA